MTLSIAERIEQARRTAESLKQGAESVKLKNRALMQQDATTRLIIALSDELDIRDVAVADVHYLIMPEKWTTWGSREFSGGEYACADVQGFTFVMDHKAEDGYGKPTRLGVLASCERGHHGEHSYPYFPERTPVTHFPKWDELLFSVDKYQRKLRSEGGCPDCVKFGLQQSLRGQVLEVVQYSGTREQIAAMVNHLLQDARINDDVMRAALAAAGYES